MTYIMPRSF